MCACVCVCVFTIILLDFGVDGYHVCEVVMASEKAFDVQGGKFKGGEIIGFYLGGAKGKWVIHVLVRGMGGRDVCF